MRFVWWIGWRMVVIIIDKRVLCGWEWIAGGFGG
jgi:hypothetical protein